MEHDDDAQDHVECSFTNDDPSARAGLAGLVLPKDQDANERTPTGNHISKDLYDPLEVQRRILAEARKKYEPYEAARAAQKFKDNTDDFDAFNNIDEAISSLKASGFSACN